MSKQQTRQAILALKEKKKANKQIIKLLKGMMIRSKTNAHRYFYFINGKMRSFVTNEKDFLNNLAALFGSLNQYAPTFAAQFVMFGLVAALSNQYAQAADPVFGSTFSGTGSYTAGAGASAGSYTQTSNVAIVNWNSFDVDAGKTFSFNMPGNNTFNLSRVTTGSPSTILGNININRGNVFLLNTNGILFGATGQVNLGGIGSFTATTIPITSGDFNTAANAAVAGGTGSFLFSGSPTNGVRLLSGAQINANGNRGVNLLGAFVDNAGTITAGNRGFNAAAGNDVTLAFDPSGTITADVTTNLSNAALGVTDAIKNTGTINVNGNGNARLIADLNNAIYSNIVNNTGVIDARDIVIDGTNGSVTLGTTNINAQGSATINVNGTGNVNLNSNFTSNNGPLSITTQTGNVNIAATSDVVSGSGQNLTINSGGTVDIIGNVRSQPFIFGGDTSITARSITGNGNVSGDVVNLNATNGVIGNGAGVNALQVRANDLTFNAADTAGNNDVNIRLFANVGIPGVTNINSSFGGDNVTISSDHAINFTGNNYSDGLLTVSNTNGDITVGGVLTSGDGGLNLNSAANLNVNGTVNVNGSGNGSITAASSILGNGTINSPNTINLTANNGRIGDSAANRLNVDANTLTFTTASTAAVNDVNLRIIGPTTVNNSSAADAANLLILGDSTFTGTNTSGGNYTVTTTGASNLTIASGATLQSTSPNDVSLTVGGVLDVDGTLASSPFAIGGNVTASAVSIVGDGTVAGDSVSLTATNGKIGDSALGKLDVRANNLTFSAASTVADNNVNLNLVGPAGPGVTTSILASNAGNNLNIDSNHTIIITGPVIANDNITFTTTGTDSDLQINNSVTTLFDGSITANISNNIINNSNVTANGNADITLTAAKGISGTGTLNATGNTVALTANDGQIGTSAANRLNVNSAAVTFNAADTAGVNDVFLNLTNASTVTNSFGGDNVDILGASALTFTANNYADGLLNIANTAGSLTIHNTLTSGDSGININANGGSVIINGTINANNNGDVNITASQSILDGVLGVGVINATGNTVTLTANNGKIGNSASDSLDVNASNLTYTAASTASVNDVYIALGENTTINNSNAGDQVEIIGAKNINFTGVNNSGGFTTIRTSSAPGVSDVTVSGTLSSNTGVGINSTGNVSVPGTVSSTGALGVNIITNGNYTQNGGTITTTTGGASISGNLGATLNNATVNTGTNFLNISSANGTVALENTTDLIGGGISLEGSVINITDSNIDSTSNISSRARNGQTITNSTIDTAGIANTISANHLGGSGDLLITSNSQINVGTNASTLNLNGNNITINGGSSVASGGALNATTPGTFTLTSAQATATEGGLTVNATDVNLNAGTLRTFNPGNDAILIDASNQVSITNGSNVIAESDTLDIQADEGITITDSTVRTNQGGQLTLDANADNDATGNLSLNNANILTRQNNITLEGVNINVDNGSEVDADSNNDNNAGNVKLDATGIVNVLADSAITGNNIDIDPTDITINNSRIDALGTFTALASNSILITNNSNVTGATGVDIDTTTGPITVDNSQVKATNGTTDLNAGGILTIQNNSTVGTTGTGATALAGNSIIINRSNVGSNIGTTTVTGATGTSITNGSVVGSTNGNTTLTATAGDLRVEDSTVGPISGALTLNATAGTLYLIDNVPAPVEPLVLRGNPITINAANTYFSGVQFNQVGSFNLSTIGNQTWINSGVTVTGAGNTITLIADSDSNGVGNLNYEGLSLGTNNGNISLAAENITGTNAASTNTIAAGAGSIFMTADRNGDFVGNINDPATITGFNFTATGANVTYNDTFFNITNNINMTATAGAVNLTNSTLLALIGNTTLNATNGISLNNTSVNLPLGDFVANAGTGTASFTNGSLVQAAFGFIDVDGAAVTVDNADLTTGIGDINLDASTGNISVTNTGLVSAGVGNVHLASGGSTTVNNGTVQTNAGNLEILANTDVVMNTATVKTQNAGTLTVKADNDANGSGGLTATNATLSTRGDAILIEAGNNSSITNSTINADSNNDNIAGNVDIKGDRDNDNNGSMALDNTDVTGANVVVTSDDTSVTNTSNIVAKTGKVDIKGNDGALVDASSVTAATNITVDANTDLDAAGAAIIDNGASLTATTSNTALVEVKGVNVRVRNNSTVQSRQDVNLTATNDVSVRSGADVLAGVGRRGNITVTAGNDIDVAGNGTTVNANSNNTTRGDVTLTAQNSINVTNRANVTATNDVLVTADSDLTGLGNAAFDSSTVQATTGSLTVNAQNILGLDTVALNTLNAGTFVDLNAAGNIDIDGTSLTAGTNITADSTTGFFRAQDSTLTATTGSYTQNANSDSIYASAVVVAAQNATSTSNLGGFSLDNTDFTATNGTATITTTTGTGSIINGSTVNAGQNIVSSAGNDLNITTGSALTAGQNTTLTADSNNNNAGNLNVTNSQVRANGGNLIASGNDVTTNAATLIASNNITLTSDSNNDNVGGTMNLTSSTITATNNISTSSVNTKWDGVNATATTGKLTITTHNAGNVDIDPTVLVAGTDIEINSAGGIDFHDASSANAGGDIKFTSAAGSTQVRETSTLTAGDDIQLSATGGNVNVFDSTLTSNNNNSSTLIANALASDGVQLTSTTGNVNINNGDVFANTSAGNRGSIRINAANNVDITNTSRVIAQNELTANADSDNNHLGNLNIDSSEVKANFGAMSLSGENIIVNNGQVASNNNTFNAQADNDITITGGTGIGSGNSNAEFNAGNNISITNSIAGTGSTTGAQALFTAGNNFSANNSSVYSFSGLTKITATAGNVDITNGSKVGGAAFMLGGNGAVDIDAGGIYTQTDSTVNGGTQAVTIDAGSNGIITNSTINGASDSLVFGGNATVTNSTITATVEHVSVLANGDLSVLAGSNITAATDVDLKADQNLNNSGNLLVSGSQVHANGGDLNATGNDVTTNSATLTASNNINLTSDSNFDNVGGTMNLTSSTITAGNNLSTSSVNTKWTDVNATATAGKIMIETHNNGNVDIDPTVLVAGTDIEIAAAGGIDFHDLSTANAGGDIKFTAANGNNLLREGSILTAGDDVNLTATNGDTRVENSTITSNNNNSSVLIANGAATDGVELKSTTANVAVTSSTINANVLGGFEANAATNITITSSTVNSALNADLTAGNDTTITNSTITAAQNITSDSGNNFTANNGDLTATAGNINVSAKNNLSVLTGSNFTAGSNVTLTADSAVSNNLGDVIINASEVHANGGNFTANGENITSTASTLTASNNIDLNARNNVSLTTTTATAGNDFTSDSTVGSYTSNTSTIKATAGSVLVNAAQNIDIDFGSTTAQVNVDMDAGNNITADNTFITATTGFSELTAGNDAIINTTNITSRLTNEIDADRDIAITNSTVSSTNRNTRVIAGRDNSINNSNINARNNVRITGRDIDIINGTSVTSTNSDIIVLGRRDVDILNSTFNAGDNIDIQADSNLDNVGGTLNITTSTLTAANNIDTSSVNTKWTDVNATATAGKLTITTHNNGNVDIDPTHLIAGTDIEIAAAGGIDFHDLSTANAGGDIKFTAANGNNLLREGSILTAGDDVNLTATNGDTRVENSTITSNNNNSSVLIANGAATDGVELKSTTANVAVTSSTINANNAGGFEANAATNITVTSSTVNSALNADLTAGNDTTITNSTITAAQNITSDSGNNFTANNGDLTATAGSITVTADNNLSVLTGSNFTAGTNATLTADSDLNDTGNVNIDASEVHANGGNLAVNGNDITTLNSTLTASNNASLTADSNNNNVGGTLNMTNTTLTGGNNVNTSSVNTNWDNVDATATAGKITVTTHNNGNVEIFGTSALVAGGDIEVDSAGSIDIYGNSSAGGDDILLVAKNGSNRVRQNSSLKAGDDVKMVATNGNVRVGNSTVTANNDNTSSLIANGAATDGVELVSTTNNVNVISSTITAIALGGFDANAANNINVENSTIDSALNADLTAGNDTTITNSTITAAQNITSDSGNNFTANNGDLTATAGSITVTADNTLDVLNGSLFKAGNNITVTADSDDSTVGNLNVTSSTLEAANNVTGRGVNVKLTDATITATAGTASFTATGGDVDVDPTTITAGTDILLDAASDVLFHDFSTATAGGDIRFRATNGNVEVTENTVVLAQDDILFAALGAGNVVLTDTDITANNNDFSTTITNGPLTPSLSSNGINLSAAGGNIYATNARVIANGGGDLNAVADGEIITSGTGLFQTNGGSGSINYIATNGDIDLGIESSSTNNVNATTEFGNIFFNNNVTAVNTINATTLNTGDILDPTDSFLLTANQVNLTSNAVNGGNINVNTATNGITFNTNGNVTIDENDDVSINGQSSSGGDVLFNSLGGNISVDALVGVRGIGNFNALAGAITINDNMTGYFLDDTGATSGRPGLPETPIFGAQQYNFNANGDIATTGTAKVNTLYSHQGDPRPLGNITANSANGNVDLNMSTQLFSGNALNGNMTLTNDYTLAIDTPGATTGGNMRITTTTGDITFRGTATGTGSIRIDASRAIYGENPGITHVQTNGSMVLIARGNKLSGDGGFIGYTNAQDGNRALNIGAGATGRIKVFAPGRTDGVAMNINGPYSLADFQFLTGPGGDFLLNGVSLLGPQSAINLNGPGAVDHANIANAQVPGFVKGIITPGTITGLDVNGQITGLDELLQVGEGEQAFALLNVADGFVIEENEQNQQCDPQVDANCPLPTETTPQQ